jgi:GTP-binding protein
MEITSAKFVKSSANNEQLPPINLPEYGFVGRSNVGKSSFINCLCERKNLAKTSTTPGKTQLINHFIINDNWYLVDLPGYGYAKVSKKKRAGFADLITNYITKRENLMNLFVLVDSRIKPQAIDLEFIEYLGVKGIPFTILLTKTDKPTQKEFSHNYRAFKKALSQVWEELPPIIQTSAVSGRGRKEVLTMIEEINPLFQPS